MSLVTQLRVISLLTSLVYRVFSNIANKVSSWLHVKGMCVSGEDGRM